MSLTIKDHYPSKQRLSEYEAVDVLRHGAPLPWFRPWAEHARVAPRATARPWGYLHVHGEWGEAPVCEFVGFYSADELRWALQRLYDRHDWHLLDVEGYLEDHECHGVFYWLPTDPHELGADR